MVGFNPGGSVSGLGPGSGLPNFSGFNKIGQSGGFDFMKSLGKFGDFLGSDAGGGLLKLGSLGLGAFGLNKSLDFQQDQLGILKQQEGRAATAQNLQTGNSLSLALQTTTPGTPEHERIKQAIADQSFAV